MYVNDQAITIKVRQMNETRVLASFIYASCLKRIRQDLWRHLSDIQQEATGSATLWLLACDFNIIADINEKQGGRNVDLLGMQEFQDFINQNGFIDAGFQGSPFTWCNNRSGWERIWERLDRVMFNFDFQSLFPNSIVSHLTHICSDHNQVSTDRKPRGSIYQKKWSDHPSFAQIVSTNWALPNHGLLGSARKIFATKLLRLRRVLKDWNWNCFGNIHEKKKELNTRIQALEIQQSSHWSDSVHLDWETCKQIYCRLRNGNYRCFVRRLVWIGCAKGIETPNFFMR